MQAGHPIAYISQTLGPKSQGLSTYEKECMAILFAVEHWRPYLQHGEFFIRTDQQSLTHLDDKRISTPWQQKALTKRNFWNYSTRWCTRRALIIWWQMLFLGDLTFSLILQKKFWNMQQSLCAHQLGCKKFVLGILVIQLHNN